MEKETIKDFTEKINKIKETVGPTTIHISRIPEKVKTRFKELAKEEFMEDWGMLLKKLIEVYDGFYPTGHEEIEMKLDILAEQIAEIKESTKEKVPEGIKSVSGKRIGGK